MGLYCALPDEPDLSEGLRRWSGSKRLAVPRVEGRCDASFRLRSPDPCPGSLRILEPGPEARLCPPGEIDLLLIPGVAFTREGRVAAVAVGITTVISQPGFRGVKIGICYAHQLVDDLPRTARRADGHLIFVE